MCRFVSRVQSALSTCLVSDSAQLLNSMLCGLMGAFVTVRNDSHRKKMIIDKSGN
jgi:hypothetical protein